MLRPHRVPETRRQIVDRMLPIGSGGSTLAELPLPRCRRAPAFGKQLPPRTPRRAGERSGGTRDDRAIAQGDDQSSRRSAGAGCGVLPAITRQLVFRGSLATAWRRSDSGRVWRSACGNLSHGGRSRRGARRTLFAPRGRSVSRRRRRGRDPLPVPRMELRRQRDLHRSARGVRSSAVRKAAGLPGGRAARLAVRFQRGAAAVSVAVLRRLRPARFCRRAAVSVHRRLSVVRAGIQRFRRGAFSVGSRPQNARAAKGRRAASLRAAAARAVGSDGRFDLRPAVAAVRRPDRRRDDHELGRHDDAGDRRVSACEELHLHRHRSVAHGPNRGERHRLRPAARAGVARRRLAATKPGA